MSLERLAPIRAEARELAERFAAGGYRVYLVGGVLRDSLLDLPLATWPLI